MPMSWDASADAKLFTVVMAVYDIKIFGAQNERIAKLMREDVTPKAITHRLSKIKAQAASFTPVTPASRKRAAPTNTKTPSSSATKASSKGSGKTGKALSATHTITTIMHDNNSDDEEDLSAFTPTHIAKKRKFGSEDREGDGDAIDFSLQHAYVNTVRTPQIKAEDGELAVVDLTADAGAGAQDEMCTTPKAKGKGKQKEAPNVKKEDEDQMMQANEDDEMVI